MIAIKNEDDHDITGANDQIKPNPTRIITKLT